MIQIKPLIFLRKSIDILNRGPSVLVTAIVTLVLLFMTSSGFAALKNPNIGGGRRGPVAKSMVGPNMQLRVHRVSRLFFSITNYGKLGSEARRIYDPWTLEPAPSCEFPGESNLEYLFQGCIWIGAVEEDSLTPGLYDTLVSIGDDGWSWDINELNPLPPRGGEILMLSTRGITAPPYADSVGTLPEDIPNRTFSATSEQDFICVFTDTIITGVNPDEWDNRDHDPLGLKLIQKSYAWSYEYAEDFILLDYEIENIGDRQLEEMWIGLYVDADVHHTSEPEYTEDRGAQNDICGFLTTFTDPADTTRVSDIYTAWIADDRGVQFPNDEAFDYRSARGLSGVRVVNWPGRNTDICDTLNNEDDIDYGFNWWISNMNPDLDFGPQLDSNFVIYPGGGKGTPNGDKAKYTVMSNGEFDYDQIFCALDEWQDSGWIANNAANPANLANGYDTRYLFSFGPFNIESGQICTLTVAYICGENLHRYPTNYADNLEHNTDNRASIETYYNNLDFSDFATNAQWASWVYDNPGIDSDTLDGYDCRGRYNLIYPGGDSSAVPDTFWYMGDGIPDFQGPPPPYSPRLDSTEIGKGYVELKWKSINSGEAGTGSEDAVDLFTGLMDFEGYAIYKSDDNLNWSLLGRYDMIDWLPLKWDNSFPPARWVINGDRQNPIPTDSVVYLAANDPLIEDTTLVDEASRDTLKTYWTAYGFNTGFDDIVEDTVIVDGEEVTNYSYTMTGLSKAKGVYFCVTAFDFGNAQTNLSSLESAKSINAILVYPIEKSDPIMVYPNPYKATNTQRYIDEGREDTDGSGWVEQDRRIWFSNFSDEQKAIIRIWSLDGDLISVITYDPTTAIGNPPGIVYWDLVSRNGQAVVSGLYLYSIEFIAIDDNVENRESEIGKFVIIK